MFRIPWVQDANNAKTPRGDYHDCARRNVNCVSFSSSTDFEYDFL